ncbi:MAG: cold shock domain-containing protein [Thermodesulfobacteriota bacterium]
MSERISGTVKWFNTNKGYGFLERPGEESDVFVHYSSILGGGYRKLDEGETVEFTIASSDKGPSAVDVQRTIEA